MTTTDRLRELAGKAEFMADCEANDDPEWSANLRVLRAVVNLPRLAGSGYYDLISRAALLRAAGEE